MQRLNRVLAASTVACGIGMLGPGAVDAQAQAAQYQSVRVVRGTISGIVSDDAGGPIGGALVSALGTGTEAMMPSSTDAVLRPLMDASTLGRRRWASTG